MEEHKYLFAIIRLYIAVLNRCRKCQGGEKLTKIREEDLDTVVSFIRKHRADYMKWKVIPEEEEMKQLGLQVA